MRCAPGLLLLLLGGIPCALLAGPGLADVPRGGDTGKNGSGSVFPVLAWFEAGDGVVTARARGCTALLDGAGATVRVAGGGFRLRIDGARGRVAALAPTGGRSHYLLGAAAAAGGARRDVPHHREALLDEALPGIDLRWRTPAGDLRFDVEVAPGADPSALRFAIEGAVARIDGAGRLAVATAGAPAVVTAPVAWQTKDGVRVPVAARWADAGDGRFGFALGAYDPSAPLVVDPTIQAGTYLGAAKADAATCIDTDATGDLWIGGATLSSAFPSQPTSGPGAVFQPSYAEAFGGPDYETRTDGFVAKLSGDGTVVAWCTFLGGSGDDAVADVAVDVNGEVVVCGATSAADFPTTPSPLASSGAGFVARLAADGAALHRSTYRTRAARRVVPDASARPVVLSEGSPAEVARLAADFSSVHWTNTFNPVTGSATLSGTGLALALNGDPWVCGTTNDSAPGLATVGSADTTYNGAPNDAIVWRIDARDGTRPYATFVGGSADDRATDVAVDAGGAVHVCGTTTSTNFPSSGGFRTTPAGGGDGFVAKIAAGGASLTWSTYLGGTSADAPAAIAVHANGHVYVAGETQSTSGFPLTGAMYGSFGGGTTDAFVTRIEASCAVVWSTYLGGGGADAATALVVGPPGRPSVAGRTASSDFPKSGPAQGTIGGADDAFVWAAEESGFPFGDVRPVVLSRQATIGAAYDTLDLSHPGEFALPGGRQPLTWAYHSGSLPSGLAVTTVDGTRGRLSGSPNDGTAGVHEFTVRVADADGACATRRFTLTVNPRMTVGNVFVPPWTVGREMLLPVYVTGGTPNFTWRTFDASSTGGFGKLPDGVTLSIDGQMLGTPRETGDFVCGVEVSDLNGATGRGAVYLHLNEPPAIEEAVLPDWTEGRPFEHTFTASLGTPPYAFSLASGTQPVATPITSDSGRMAGTTLAPGDYAFDVRVTDAAGASATRTYSMHVNVAPSVATTSVPLALVDRPYRTVLTSDGGTGGRTWGFGEGTIPAGFVLTQAGALQGLPNLARDFTFDVTSTDACGAVATRPLTLTVVPFLSLADPKRSAVRDVFGGEGGATAPVLRYLEVLPGTRLDGSVRLVGKGKLGVTLALVDVDTGETLDLGRKLRTRGTTTTFSGVVFDRARRVLVVLTPADGFAGTVDTKLTARAQAAWRSAEPVDVDPAAAEPVAVRFSAARGAVLTFTVARAPRSRALPTVVSVLGPDGAELLVEGELSATRTGAVLRVSRPLALAGEVTVLLAGLPAGEAGACRWTASLRGPKGYDVQLFGRLVGTPE